MIVVTGANGPFGRAVVEHLLRYVAADQVGVSVRDPEQSRALADRGLRVRRGDFTDAGSLTEAFADADRVLVVSPNVTGEAAVRMNRTAIDAARTAGVKRVLYTSHMGAGAASAFDPMRDHAATEVALAESGIAFTALHNGFYAETVPMLLQGALATGELTTPDSGPVAWTARDDLAEAAAVILANDSEDLDGLTPPLTAGAAIDLTEVAAIATEVHGRPIRYVEVSDADYRTGLISHGVPEAAADMLLGIFAAGRDGDFATVDPTLTRLLGRPPLSLGDLLRRAQAAAA